MDADCKERVFDVDRLSKDYKEAKTMVKILKQTEDFTHRKKLLKQVL